MTRLKFAAAALGLTISVLAAAPASAWKRGDVNILAELPFATGVFGRYRALVSSASEGAVLRNGVA